MRKPLRSVACIIGVAAFMGCGSSSNDEYTNAAPISDTISLDLDSSDNANAQALTTNDCHPHLFVRTHLVVRTLNHHLGKIFGRLDKLIDNHPKTKTGTTHIWEKLLDNKIMVKTTLTKVAEGQFTLNVQFKTQAQPDSAYVTVVTGTTNKTDGTPHTGKGTYTIDYTALQTVMTAAGITDNAKGTLALTFYVDATSKKVALALTNFVGEAASPSALPQTANYVYARTAGQGGSFKFQDNMTLYCPSTANAVVETIAKWQIANGAVNGRADSTTTSSGLTWLATSCWNATVATASADAGTDASRETYWQIKQENATQVTYFRDATSISGNTFTAGQCAFPPIPANNAVGTAGNDPTFPPADDGKAYPYPGMPQTF